MKKHKKLKIVLISVGVFLGLLLGFVGGVLIFASATTLQVKDQETMQINGHLSSKIDASQELSMLTWNAGYGALDEKQDCYWDGGKGVYGESKEKVEENIHALEDQIKEIDPDIFFLQELDLDSKRSYYINEYDDFRARFDEDHYESTFAKNFKAGLVPLPVYQMTGKVDAGIATFSKYHMHDASRIQLPIPFAWPMNLFNLKRCLLLSRINIEGSNKELVIINLHLEAYDDGEGKAKQLAMLMETMQQEVDKGNYVIAGGDFNQTFSSINYQQYPKMNDWVCPVIDASSYPSFSFAMDDTHPTCRSLYKIYEGADHTNFQYYMIDGFIVSNNIEIRDIKTIHLDFKNTDHNPVQMKIALA